MEGNGLGKKTQLRAKGEGHTVEDCHPKLPCLERRCIISRHLQGYFQWRGGTICGAGGEGMQ